MEIKERDKKEERRDLIILIIAVFLFILILLFSGVLLWGIIKNKMQETKKPVSKKESFYDKYFKESVYTPADASYLYDYSAQKNREKNNVYTPPPQPDNTLKEGVLKKAYVNEYTPKEDAAENPFPKIIVPDFMHESNQQHSKPQSLPYNTPQWQDPQPQFNMPASFMECPDENKEKNPVDFDEIKARQQELKAQNLNEAPAMKNSPKKTIDN